MVIPLRVPLTSPGLNMRASDSDLRGVQMFRVASGIGGALVLPPKAVIWLKQARKHFGFKGWPSCLLSCLEFESAIKLM